MIVAVMSPQTEGNGNTITSIFLALGLATSNKKVLLKHTNPNSGSFYKYLGLEQYEDKTTTPTQLVKLLRQGAIQPEEITDYCKHAFDGLDVFTTKQTSFTDKDMYINKISKNKYEVKGKLVEENIEKTDFNNEAAVQRFMRILRHNNLNDLMQQVGIKEGDTVIIGPMEYEYIE